ncbi:MAG: DUF58 domain-containing protein [Nevskiaceae bacterium]|jgi:uncharacterized protein (DUF58 family)|nr:DUF58 domain-containing protein [Nevskiaceae bacterium]
MNRRRLYILPTRTGLAFGGLLAIAFIAALNYGSGLAMLLTFWLTGFAIAAMLRTHRMMVNVRLTSLHAQPVFAGQNVPVRVHVDAAVALQDVAAAAKINAANVTLNRDFDPLDIDPPSGDSGAMTLQFPPASRGVWKMPPIKLSTHAPFGLFRTWTWFAPPVETQIYPRPEGGRAMPETPGDTGGLRHDATAAGFDELTSLRPFREGDSPRQVAWKAYARNAPLLVREYRDNVQLAREFNYDALSGSMEQRLSQLCEWVLQAATRGERYRLRLPSVDLDGSGPAHRNACLSALAQYQ